MQKYEHKCSKTKKSNFQIWGFTAKKLFFLRNSSGRIVNIGTVVKANSKSITGKNMKKIGEDVYLIFDLKLDNIQIKFSQNFFNRAQNPVVEKNFGPRPFGRS